VNKSKRVYREIRREQHLPNRRRKQWS